jgi:hypothetical protein
MIGEWTLDILKYSNTLTKQFGNTEPWYLREMVFDMATLKQILFFHNYKNKYMQVIENHVVKYGTAMKVFFSLLWFASKCKVG